MQLERFATSNLSTNSTQFNMTQEEKQLLLIDLCARLPYGVRMNVIRSNVIEVATYISPLNDEIWVNDAGAYVDVEEVRPYLRPMSSMTKEEREDLWPLLKTLGITADVKRWDWLSAHHFDYRGLIEKGLALEAPEGMYKVD